MAASPTFHRVNLLENVDLAKPLCCGMLFKQGHTHTSFNKRFFVLFPRVLVYYHAENNFKRDVGRGTLVHCKKVNLEGVYLSKLHKKPQGAKFCFLLHCPHKSNNRKELLLVGETREDKKKWMLKLQEQNPALVEPTGNASSSSSTLGVPRQLVRVESATPADYEEQNLHVTDASSDTE